MKKRIIIFAFIIATSISYAFARTILHTSCGLVFELTAGPDDFASEDEYLDYVADANELICNGR